MKPSSFSRLIVPLGLCFLLLFHGSHGQALVPRCTSRQQSPRLSGRSECQIEKITAREPSRQQISEAGYSEFWDSGENDELECAGVEVVRHIINPKGLLLPYYPNAPELAYVLQGQGLQGTVLPGCQETFETVAGGRGEFPDEHQRVYRFKEGDVLALPAGSVHWTYNDGDSQLVLVTLRDTSNVANQLDRNFKKFFLAGNPQSQMQGGYGSPGGYPEHGERPSWGGDSGTGWRPSGGGRPSKWKPSGGGSGTGWRPSTGGRPSEWRPSGDRPWEQPTWGGDSGTGWQPSKGGRPSEWRPSGGDTGTDWRPSTGGRPSKWRPSGDRPWEQPSWGGDSGTGWQPSTGGRPSEWRPSGDRPSKGKPSGDRPWERPSGGDTGTSPTGHPGEWRPSGDRPSKGKPSGDRPWERPSGGDTGTSPTGRPGEWRPSGDRPSKGKPSGDRPWERPSGGDTGTSPTGRPGEWRPSGDRPSKGKPSGDRPWERPSGGDTGTSPTGRPGEWRPSGDRPSKGKPSGDRPWERPSGGDTDTSPTGYPGEWRPSGDRPSKGKPSGDRPWERPSGGDTGTSPTGRPGEWRPSGDRPSKGKPSGDRPWERPSGGDTGTSPTGRPGEWRPSGDRPSKGKPSGDRPWERPSGGDTGTSPTGRPGEWRPSGDRPSKGKPSGDRPWERPSGGDTGTGMRPSTGDRPSDHPSTGRPSEKPHGEFGPGAGYEDACEVCRRIRRAHGLGDPCTDYNKVGTQQEQESLNMFAGFDDDILEEVLDVDYEIVRQLKGLQDDRGIIVLAEDFQVSVPDQEQFSQRGNGIEQTICSTQLSANIASPAFADVYNPRGGRISTLNSHKLPVLDSLQLSAERGVLYKNALLAPHYNLNAHSIIYITRGNSRLQIVQSNGSPVFDDEVYEGQLIVVPQDFVVVKKAGEQGCEWVAFKTNDNAITSQLAGRFSYIQSLPEEVLANSYNISRQEAKSLKYNRNEGVILSPHSRSSTRNSPSPVEKAKNVVLNALFG